MPSPKTDELRLCVQTYVTSNANGTPVTIRVGELHRASGYPARHPQYYVTPGSDADEIGRVRGELFSRRLEQ
jgi:hypothetical protein